MAHSRGEFPASVVVNGRTYTLTGSTAPQWALHKLRWLTNKASSTNLDGNKLNKAERYLALQLAERFGV